MISSRSVIPLFLALAILAGCSSKQQKALDQAKQQAASTGHPQQIVSVDNSGTTTTTTVQPPAPGQKQQAITTATVPAPTGQPKPAAHDPVVSAVTQSAPSDTDANAPMATYGQGPETPAQPASAQPSAQSPAQSAAPMPVRLRVPAGTPLAIRVDQTISVKTSHPGEGFSGEVVRPVVSPTGTLLIPKGSRVRGVVDAAHRRGHFKGRSILELRLTTITLNGQEYPLATADIARSKKGKGKRSWGMIGGGTGLGMLIGGVATGGAGLLIGGLAGGGAGTAAAGLTGNRDITIPAESVVQFRLAHDLVVKAG